MPHAISRFALAENTVPSQRVLRVSPGGRWLAYRDSEGLSLMDGRHNVFSLARTFEDFRFSPDGRWLAVAVRTAATAAAPDDMRPADELVFYDLTGKTPRKERSLRIDGIDTLEWSAAGVIAQHVAAPKPKPETWWSDPRIDDELLLVPIDGAPRAIYRGVIDRFASAARSTRVVIFAVEGIVDFDLAHPGSKRVSLRPDLLANIEMAADGSALIFVLEDGGVFALDAAGRQRPLAGGSVTALWSADDGARFVWSGSDGVHLGAGDYPIVRAPVQTLRFRRDAPGLIAVDGGRVVTWGANGNEPVEIFRPQGQRRVIAADRFAGGLVVWLEE